jgi:hypothetical protein
LREAAPPIAAPLLFDQDGAAQAAAVGHAGPGQSSKIYFCLNPAPIVAMRVVQATVVVRAA